MNLFGFAKKPNFVSCFEAGTAMKAGRGFKDTDVKVCRLRRSMENELVKRKTLWPIRPACVGSNPTLIIETSASRQLTWNIRG